MMFHCYVFSLFIGMGVALPPPYQVNEDVTMERVHATYEQHLISSNIMYKDFYFFNLTNAEEFHLARGGVKPNLTELGPYSYIENRTKSYIVGSCDDDEISYTQTKIFKFDSNASGHGLLETDKICTINIPLVAAINITKNIFLKRTALFTLVKTLGTKLYVCQNARDLAWNYTDSLIKALHQTRQFPENYVNIQVNNSIFDRNVSTIYNHGPKIGQFIKWDGLSLLKTWPGGDPWPKGTGANCINGTEGLFFKPNLQEGDNLTAFVDDIQRSIDLKFTGKASSTAFRYGIKNSTFKSAFNEPENARWGSWCPDGLIYIGPTQVMEIPVYGSKPHFLDGDPGLLDSVVGLNPDREKHDTVIDVEPTTGVTISFRKQIQVNVQINRTSMFPMEMTSKIRGFRGTSSLYFPVLYVNEHSKEDRKAFQDQKGYPRVFNTALPDVFRYMPCAGIKRRVGDERLTPPDL